MKNLFVIILLLFVFTGVSKSQVENKRENYGNSLGKFSYDLLCFASDKKGDTRVDAFVQVPYSQINFVKTDKNYSAGYSVTVSVFNDEDKDKLIVEKMWNEQVNTDNFDETTAKKNFNLSLRSFNLEPGKYFFRIAVEDKDSRKSSFSEKAFTVRNLSEPFSVSDIMMIAKKTQDKGSNKILPNISRNILDQKEGIPLFFEIYSDTSVPVKIEYNILDEKKDVIYKKTDGKGLSKGKNQIFYTIMDSSLGLGNYIISVAVKNSADQNLAVVNKPFISRWIGFPAVVKNLDEAVEQLVYIASSKEIDYIEDAKTKDEEIKRYREFWKKKDPSPATEENQVFDEYYRRIAYADENFSHYIEGWKTDRGMVFIILGPPNNVDRHPFDFDAKPYEVWEYYDLNKTFVFVDQTGFGDYRLVTPMYGDLYRYRN